MDNFAYLFIFEARDNQINMTIGKEDVTYCAAFCHEKINILFMHPTNYFTSLFRDKFSKIFENPITLDPNSPSMFQVFCFNNFFYKIYFKTKSIVEL